MNLNNNIAFYNESKHINLWKQSVFLEAKKWGHIIYKITGTVPTRRSIVLWSCTKHPNAGKNTFIQEDKVLKKYVQKNILCQKELNQLIVTYPGEQFFASRMDEYLKLYKKTKNRKVCCIEKLYKNRRNEGFEIFKKLLIFRGNHYRTKYTLLITSENYKGKHIKYPIKCESHGICFSYSMQNLNYITSCPCPMCRTDVNHKNKSVEIIKKRNASRPGLIRRHSLRVKKKYNFKCALSDSTFDLHYHHLDGQDFYT